MADDIIARVDEGHDLSGLFSIIRRQVPLVLASVILFVVLAFLVSKFLPRHYTAEAQLEYSPQETVSGTSNQPLSDLARDAKIDAQVQSAASLPVAVRVVEKLHLEKDPELASAAAEFVGKDAQGKQAIAAALLRNLNVTRVGTTTLFQISYTDKRPVKAMNIASAFADAYLDTELAVKMAQYSQTEQKLATRLQTMREEVELADGEVARFRIANNLLSQPDSVSTEQEISAIRTDLAMARADSAAASSRSSDSRSTVIGGGSSSPVSTAALASLQQQQAEVAKRVAALQSRYGDRHPVMLDARKELASIDAQLTRERAGLTRSTYAEGNAAGSRAASLQSSLSSAQARMAANVAASVKLGDLQRQAQVAREAYQQLLTTNNEQNASQSLAQADSRLASPATLPLDPSSPNVPVLLFLGAVAGLGIGLAIAFLRERWVQGLNTVDDIETLVGVDYLNSVPTPKSSIDNLQTDDPVEAVLLHPMSAYSESFRNLATSLSYAAKSDAGKVIGVTSSLPKEGKTTTSIAIARVLAAAGSSVILIDSDLRRRSVSKELASTAKLGLADVLSGKAPLDTVLFRDSSGMDVLPLTGTTPVTPKIFEDASFDALMLRLRKQYEYIILDTAPILAVTDTRMLLRQFDALALLVRWRSTPVRAVRAAVHQINAVGGDVTGIALTMVNLKTQAQSGHGDPSYYTGYMKDYYNVS